MKSAFPARIGALAAIYAFIKMYDSPESAFRFGQYLYGMRGTVLHA
jgi:hypothetical protein